MRKLLLLIAIIAVCGGCAEEKKTHVNWATFNLRYDNPEDSLNNWKYRKDSVAAYILSNNISIVGMQEALYNQIEDLVELLPGYAYVGVCRDDGDKEGEASPIFYDTDRFNVIESNTFWLSEYPDSVGRLGWDAACPRVATWAKMLDKRNGKVFMAINTHFDHVGMEARKNSALLIIDRIKEIVGSEPAVLTGDFNVGARSEAYETITTNEFVLRDTYVEAEVVTGPAYTWHDFGKCPKLFRDKIDFIFVTEGIKVLSEHIYQEHDYDPEVPQSEWGYISDHNPLWTEIEF